MAMKTIESQEQAYKYLKDFELRKKETNLAPITITDTHFPDGGDFSLGKWLNVNFEYCTFEGGWLLHTLANATFKNCTFKKINFQAHYFDHVHFLLCETTGQSYIMSTTNSKDTVFEKCHFAGNDPQPNNFGAISPEGDVTFKECRGENTDVSGKEQVIYQDCQFDNVQLGNGNAPAGQIKGHFAEVLIDGCEFKNEADLGSFNKNLTIRNTQFDILDIDSASILGALTVEKSKGGYLNIAVHSAKSITVKDSEFTGWVDKNGLTRSFNATGGGNALETVDIENVKCVEDEFSGKYSKGVRVGGGIKSFIIKNFETPICRICPNSLLSEIDGLKAQSVSFSDSEEIGVCKIKNLNAQESFFERMKAKEIDLEAIQCQTVNFTDSEIGTLRFVKDVYVGKRIDFTNAKIGAADFGGIQIEKGNRLGIGATKAVTTGSNLEVVKGQLQLKK